MDDPPLGFAVRFTAPGDGGLGDEGLRFAIEADSEQDLRAGLVGDAGIEAGTPLREVGDQSESLSMLAVVNGYRDRVLGTSLGN